MRNYDGNPYAAEQGPADEETDPITDELEAADEYICEAMGEWSTVAESQIPDDMMPLHQARECIHNAQQARYKELSRNAQPVETKPGNECRSCTNWVDVENGYDTCADCLAKQ